LISTATLDMPPRATKQSKPEAGHDLIHNLKLLMGFRVLFSSLLLGSTIILQLSEGATYLERNLVVLYELAAGIFLLSTVYFALINRVRRDSARQVFAYVQLSIDTVTVSLIIFVTGSYSSIFTFLYLIVIVYSSILVFRPGVLAIAALCSIQYGLMIDLEFYGLLDPFSTDVSLSALGYPWSYVLYKVLITMVACFAVAFLSSLLSERERRTKRELAALEDRIKRVEKMAAMGEMAAGLAHEIRNPLASLTGSIQLLREEIEPDPVHSRLMDIVLRETERLSELVTSFLLYARPPAGSNEAIQLDRALSDIVSLFEKDESCAGRIDVGQVYQPDVWIRMDAGHLRQVVWNLLANAADAIEEKGRIDIEMAVDKDQKVYVDITDTGCGMTREMMQSIFDPFFTTKPKGTGLGLSIAFSILEMYGGSMDVSSRVSEGTRFSLCMGGALAS